MDTFSLLIDLRKRVEYLETQESPFRRTSTGHQASQGITAPNLNVGTSVGAGAGDVRHSGQLWTWKWAEIGNGDADYVPNGGNWRSGATTLLLTGRDQTSIGFHDSNNRVDFITGGGGFITLGYNAGWGAAHIVVPGLMGVNGAGINGGVGFQARAVSGAVAIRAVSSGGTATFDVWDNGEVTHYFTTLHHGTTYMNNDVGVGHPPVAHIRQIVRGSNNTSGRWALTVQRADGADLFWARNDGYLWANRAWDVSSDRRLKDDIEDLDDELTKVRKVRWRRYKRKNRQREDDVELGVVAQELREVYPDLVSEFTPPPSDEVPNPEPELAVNYQGLAIAQGKALAQLAVEVDTLKDEIKALRDEVKALRKK